MPKTYNADEKYLIALELVPVIIFSYLFIFLYSIFMLYVSYRKRTGLISLNTFIAGFANIGLNYWLIPNFVLCIYVEPIYILLNNYVSSY